MKKTKGKDVTIVAVEPETSPVITQALAGEEIQPGPHKIQGIGAGFIPGNLDLKLLDKVIQISDDEAVKTARELMEKKVSLQVFHQAQPSQPQKRLPQTQLLKTKILS
ncbi:hypothetical protein MASR2M36_37840 [Providencia sp.]